MKNVTLLFLCLVLFAPAQAQLTPEQSLNLVDLSIHVPDRFKATMPNNYTVHIVPGYKARVFYAGGLGKPRFMSFDDSGVLHVSDMTNGKVYALPDADNNGEADTLLVAADGFTDNHDVKFYNGNMYVTEEQKVWKLTDADKNGVYEQRTVFIDNIASQAPQPTGGHRTRTIAFDEANAKAYLSIGSRCNACREEFRACIEQYDINGTNRRIYASGIRNAIGLAFHPVTNRLWANNNGSDNQGNAIPPEWIDLVRDGGFYGYPLAYGNKTWLDFNAAPDYQALKPITQADSARVERMIFPAAQVEAHSAPMALAFLNPSFPANLRHGMITALHGSWNAPGDHRGYKLVYLHLSDAQDTTVNFVADFLTGFITDTVAREYWGRPCGLAVNQKGEIFMSSDETTRFILHIYPDPSVGLKEKAEERAATLFPNPAGAYTVVKLGSGAPAAVSLFDMSGRNVYSAQAAEGAARETVISTSGLDAGVYHCVITQEGKVMNRKLVICR